MPLQLELKMLGTLDVHIDHKPANNLLSNKAQALLCYLAVSGRVHSRIALSGLLWGDTPEEQARASLRQALSKLTELCADYFTVTRQTIAFDRTHLYSFDIERFEVAAARLSAAPGLVELHADLDLYGGDFLNGFYVRNAPDFENWMLGVRARYREMALQAFNSIAIYWMENGNWAQAIFYSRRLLEIEPWHEGAHRLLMQLLAQTGQRTAALGQYRLYRQLLAEELGVEPDGATQTLYAEIKSNRWAASSPSNLTTLSTAQRDVTEGTKPLPELPLPAFLAGDDPDVAPASAFVGRRRELATLAAALEKARSGQGQLRFVTGGVGQGKSALIQEFIRQAQADDRELLVITGYCNAYTGTGDPYLPFREVLALLAGEVENQGAAGKMPVENARRLWSALPTTLPSLVEHAPNLIGPFVRAQSLLERAAGVVSPNTAWFKQLATLTANTQSTPLDEQQIFAQFTAVLQAIAKQYPLLLILEDLHWVDGSSSGLLFYLSRTISHSRILVLGTYRPDEIALDPKTVAGREEHELASMMGEFKRQHGAIWLDLDAITAGEGREFLEEYVDTQPNQLDAAFRSALFQHTGGHALFTVELLHEMQARGDLRQDNEGRWVTSQQLDWHALPAKVEGVIERQLARLDTTTQAILRVACVQGESLTAEVIAKVLQLNEQAVVQQLSQELSRQQRLVSAQELTWVGGQRLSHYRFRHYLFQRYLYQSLDEMESAYLHEAVGNALESIYGEEATQIAVELSYHFQRAGLIEKAVDALLLAAKHAQQVAAFRGAIHHLTEGLALLEKLPVTEARLHRELDSLTLLAAAMESAGDYDLTEVEDIYLRARMLCQQLGEREKLWPILYGLFLVHHLRGHYYQAHRVAKEQLLISQDEPTSEPHLIAAWMMSTVSLVLGDFVPAVDYANRMVELYDPLQHQRLRYRYANLDLGLAGLAAGCETKTFAGYFDQARRDGEAMVTIASESGHPYLLAQALLQNAWTHEVRREIAEEKSYITSVILLAEEYHFHLFLGNAHMGEGRIMIVEGQIEAGMERLLQGLAEVRAFGHTMAQSHYATFLVEGYMALGQSQKGIKVIDEALAEVDQSGEHWFDAELHRLRGDFLSMQGEAVEIVEGYYEKAIEIAQRQQGKLWELRATVSLARLWQTQGRTAAARERLAEIYGWFTEGFNTPDMLAAKSLLTELA